MILITGATGLLGGHLLYGLLQQYDRVAALRRPSAKTDTLHEIFSYYTKDPDSLLDRIEWRVGDMLDKHSLIKALDGIDCVINCAAIVSYDKRDRQRMITNNVEGTRNLAEAIKTKTEDLRQEDLRQEDLRQKTLDGKPVMIHISSIAALGDGPGNDTRFLIDEETPRDPNRKHNGYSISKYESEKVLNELGIDAIILNPGIILGPGQWVKGSSQLFEKAWTGLKYYPYGGTGYVDVRDIADIVLQIIKQVSGIGYQVSGNPNPVSCLRSSVSPSKDFCLRSSVSSRYCLVGANLRYREFFNLVTDEFGKPNPTIFADLFLTEIAWRADTLRARLTGRNPVLTRETAAASQRISYYSSAKIQKALNFKFRPIEETIDWVATLYKNSIIS